MGGNWALGRVCPTKRLVQPNLLSPRVNSGNVGQFLVDAPVDLYKNFF